MATRWFYEQSGATVGPRSEAEMADLITRARIEMTTPVWSEDQPERKPVVQHPDLARYYPPWAVAELSPEVLGPAPASKGYAWSPRAKSLKGRQTALRVGLALYMLVETLVLLANAVTLWVFVTLTAGGSIQGFAMMTVQAALSFAQVSPLAVSGAYIVCIVCYLMFVHRASQNLHFSNARGLTISPGATVGWSFAPILNFFMVFAAMREIWIVSANPETGRTDAPVLLGWWWGAFLGGNILSRISASIAPNEADMSAARSYFDVYSPSLITAIAANTLLILSCFLLIRVVKQVTDSQETLRSLAAFDD